MDSRRSKYVLVALALVGGMVGGALVAVVWHLADSPDPGSCDVQQVAGDVLPSVVTVSVTLGERGGTGSGVVVESEGGETYIVSNDHVTALGRQGATIEVTYADGHTSPATLVGGDPVTDLSVLVAEDASEHARAITVGDSGDLRVGQPVVALGAPLGLRSTVTAGIVSATGRPVPVPTIEGGDTFLRGSIQTDASINPGNSGGALVDCDGDLVGINTAGSTPEGDTGSVGLNFAIPTSLMVPLATELIDTGRVSHPTLGIQVQGIPDGVFVQAVDPAGPAAAAGLQPGDIITEIDGTDVRTADDLTRLEIHLDVGDEVDVTYVRDGEPGTTTVTTGETG